MTHLHPTAELVRRLVHHCQPVLAARPHPVHQRRAEPKIEIHDGIGRVEGGELARILEARQDDVAACHRGVNDPSRGAKIP